MEPHADIQKLGMGMHPVISLKFMGFKENFRGMPPVIFHKIMGCCFNPIIFFIFHKSHKFMGITGCIPTQGKGLSYVWVFKMLHGKFLGIGTGLYSRTLISNASH